MKRVFILLLIVSFAAAFSACAGGAPAESEGPGTDLSVSAPEVGRSSEDVMPFIGKDEIYFEILLFRGLFDRASVKVGDQELTDSGTVRYTGDEDVSFEGTSASSGAFPSMRRPLPLFSQQKAAGRPYFLGLLSLDR